MFETATTPQRCMLVTLMVFSIGCGPAIYSADSETVAASDKSELERVSKL